MAESTGTIASLKDFVTFLREGTIAVVLLLFLCVPSCMQGVLSRAGFVSADVGGFKWELQTSARQTEAASETVAQLERKLSALNDRLEQIGRSAAPEVKQQIAALTEDLGKTRAQTSSAQATLRDSLAVQRSVIRKVDPKLLEQMGTRGP